MYCSSVQVIKDEAENQRQVTMQLFFILLCVWVTTVSPNSFETKTPVRVEVTKTPVHEPDLEVAKLEDITSRIDYFYFRLEALEVRCKLAFVESQEAENYQQLSAEVISLQADVALLNQTVDEAGEWKDFLSSFFYIQTIFDNLFVVALLVSFFPLYVKVYRREWRIIKDEQRKEVLRKAAREEILHPHCGEKRDYTGFTRARVTRSSPADDTVLPPGRL